jgi:hypothetical protein
MTSPRVLRADEILEEILDSLAADSLAGVTVTLDPGLVSKSLALGVVVITPPDLTFPTFTLTETTWELWVIAGPAQDIRAAWSRIDSIAGAIARGLAGVTTARAESYQLSPTSAPVPAYVLTLTESTID